MGDVIADWPRDRILSLLTVGRRYGVNEADLLEGTGATLSTIMSVSHRITAQDEHTVIRNLQAHTSPRLPLALEAGLDFHLPTVGSWGQAIRTCPNLGTAIAFAFASAQAFAPTVPLSAQVRGDQLVINLEDHDLPEDIRVFLGIRAIIYLAMTGRELLGKPVRMRAVRARSPRLPYAEKLDQFCGQEITWDAPVTQMVTDLAWMAHPLPGADAEAHAQAMRAATRMVDAHRELLGFRERVRSLLQQPPAVTGRDAPTASWLAAQLNLPERTLRRHLAQEGTSFRDLVGQHRRAQAQELLASGHSIDEVAHRLGYSEAAAFSRAFKRWTGTSPDTWRRSMAGGPGSP